MSAIRREFLEFFGGECTVVRAPGRVNLIGEHTDYNEGFVIPGAIGLSARVAAAGSNLQRLALHSTHFHETVELNFAEIDSGARRNHWSDYICGVAFVMRQVGWFFPGANLLVESNVPLGSGLSSSAAIEVATAFALLNLAGIPMPRIEIARLCQRAENEFAGVRCGIMDQFASCYGKKDHVILLDCRSLEPLYLRLPPGVNVVVSNTMAKHEIAAGEYNLRRQQCEEALRKLRERIPEITALRDVSPQQLERFEAYLEPVINRRAKHVVDENQRVLAGAQALLNGNVSQFGELMNASHASLRDLYEVSCPELDLMTGIAMKCPGVYGARMMGGGFGGCTISLVDESSTPRFIENMTDEYREATGIQSEVYICTAEDGAGQEDE